jgi:hypothetical protein
MAGGLSHLRFERSEVALAAVNRALGRFETEIKPREARSILHHARLLIGSPSTTREAWSGYQTEDALTRVVSIADEFTFGLFIEVAEARLPVDPRVEVLWERYVERDADTWTQRFGAWENLHRVPIKTFPRYDRLLGFIDARNAIVHGLGSLTRKQLKTRHKVTGHLKSAGIGLSGTRLVLAPQHVRDCAAVVRGLIEWLDGEAAVAP